MDCSTRPAFVARGAALSVMGLGWMMRIAQQFSTKDYYPAELIRWSPALLLGIFVVVYFLGRVAFLRKAGRTEAMPYVHGGWIGALAAGGATWLAATYLVDISGASREVTEGFAALFAAVVLVSIGIWMHGKSQADAWQRYIREKLSHALSRGSMWFLFLLAFVVVYREAFEIVLFYQALWVQAGESGRHAVLGGVAVAALLLAVLAWAILKYSVRLPIGPFFAATAWLLALLAVVFAGHGVAALQEAGVLDARPFGSVSIPMLGVHPTVLGLGVQAIALVLVLLGVWMARRRTPERVAA